MSSKPLVNQSGTIKNVSFLGFTTIGAWGELIDNSNDAGAKEVRIGVFKWTDEDGIIHYGYYIADDASGMNKPILSDSCILNNTQEGGSGQSFGDKSGRFGVGGTAALIVISKKPGGATIEKITRSSESRNLLAVEVVYNNNDKMLCPTAHEASRRQEELWLRLSIHPAGTGTLIIGEVDEKIYSGLVQLMSDNTVDGLIRYIATTFHRKIDAGLIIGIKHYADDSAAADAAATRVICSFNPSGSLDDARVTRASHEIPMLKEKTTGEFKFAVRGGGDDEPCLLSLPPNTKVKCNTKLTSLSLESYDIVGIVQNNLAWSGEWRKIHDEQQDGQFDKGNLTNFNKNTIVRQYIRSDRCVKSIPTPKRKQGDKSAYPFYENVIQEIIMPTTEVSDELFGTQVNKSQLDENKIHPELKKLIDHLSNVFSDSLWKLNTPESQRKKKSRSSDDATSVASDDTEIVNDDDADALLLSSSSVPAAGGGGAAAVVAVAVTPAKQPPKKTAKKIQPQIEEEDVVVVPSFEPEPEPAAPEPEPVQPPVISTVSTHTALRITRSTGLGYLARLYEEQDIAEIVVLLDDNIREFQDRMSRTQADVFLMFMQPADKYRMLLHLLDSGSPDDFMKGGSKLYDVYHQYYSE
jgi:hypothetical protein